MSEAEIRRRHIQKLQWLILFLQVKLEECSPGDKLKLKENLFEFIYDHTVRELTFRKGLIGGMSREMFCNRIVEDEHLSNLQRILLGLFQPFRKVGVPIFEWKVDAMSFTLMAFPLLSSPFIQHLELIGTGNDLEHLSQVTKIAFAEHLIGSQIGADQILTCPECDRLFLAVPKKRKDRLRYCSVRCSQRAATRRFRKDNQEEFKQKERQRSNRRYRQKVLGKKR